MSRKIVGSLWGRSHVNWFCLDSNGASGGMLIMWDNRVVEKVEECVGAYTLAVSFRNVVDLLVWANVASGGILIMWDNRMVEKVEECVGA
jgi:predicted RNA-binding protein